jgi:hypothetical protein
MKINMEKIRLRVQETVDELFSERLIPFKLTAYNVSGNSLGEYVVRFHDSRLHSIRFSSEEGQCLLDRVKGASGSLMVLRSLTPQLSLGLSN